MTYRSWVGQGPESEAVINLKPVAKITREEPKLQKSEFGMVAPNQDIALQSSAQLPQLDQELIQTIDGSMCLNSYPSGLVNLLAVIIVLLISSIIGIVSYYFYKKSKSESMSATSDEFEDIKA